MNGLTEQIHLDGSEKATSMFVQLIADVDNAHGLFSRSHGSV